MDIFAVATQKFIQSEENQGKVFLRQKEIRRSRSVRLLYLKNSNDKSVEVYVIKTPYVEKMEVSREWVNLLKNEVEVQLILSGLGFRSKKFLVTDLDVEDIRKCYTISTYIPGHTFEEVCSGNLVRAYGLMADYLYKLHSTTISEKYGFISFGPSTESVGSEESRFLRADIIRDGIFLNPRAWRGLSEAMTKLDKQKRFCLCHCDVTLRNAIWDGKETHLIDWERAKFTHPASDIANILFWLMERELFEVALIECERANSRYQQIGFSLMDVLPFYLGQRYIEFGRFKGDKYIRHGIKILEMTRASDFIGDLFSKRNG